MRGSGRNQPMSSSTNPRTSLFGDLNKRKSESSFGQQQSEELLERDNERQLEELSGRIKNIKEVTLDIQSAIKDSNNMLDQMNPEADRVQGLMGTAMVRLNRISNQGGSRLICYLVAFIVFVFLLLYFMVLRR